MGVRRGREVGPNVVPSMKLSYVVFLPGGNDSNLKVEHTVESGRRRLPVVNVGNLYRMLLLVYSFLTAETGCRSFLDSHRFSL